MVAALLCQALEPEPAQAVVGAPVRVVARDELGQAIGGLPVTLRDEDGAEHEVGLTDASGSVELALPAPGRYSVHALLRRPDRPAAVELVAPIHARAAGSPWLHAAWCTPLGLALLWWQLRALRRGGGGATRAPSRPSP